MSAFWTTVACQAGRPLSHALPFLRRLAKREFLAVEAFEPAHLSERVIGVVYKMLLVFVGFAVASSEGGAPVEFLDDDLPVTGLVLFYAALL